MNTGKSHARKNEQSSVKVEQPEDNVKFNPIAWRQEKVWQLRSQGFSVREIVSALKGQNEEIRISIGTVERDLKAKKVEINKEFRTYIEERLPAELELSLTAISEIMKQSWMIFAKTPDPKIRLDALDTIERTIMAKHTVLGDIASIQKALETVSELRKQLTQIREEEEEGQEVEK